ncbi:MAG: hypothetical protein AB3N12_01435 [Ruegeria sp.]
MNIFHFHPDTGEYLGQGIADRDPLDSDRYLIPYNATTEEPPTIGSNKVRVHLDGDWSVQDDYRGTEYWLDGQRFEITEIGEVVPEDAVLTDPGPPVLSLEEQRAVAVLPKPAFCRALKDLGVLPPLEAAAALRGEWPPTFASYTSGMSDDDAAEAEMTWVEATNIHYSHPTLQALALSHAGGDPAQATIILDQIYGITP